MSVVANGGFESPLGPLLTSPPQPVYYGGWSPFQGYNAAPHQPTRVTSQKTEGDYGLHITADSGTGKGNWVLQDFPSSVVNADQGLYFQAWVKPITGNEQMQVAFDYDRGPGTSLSVVVLDFTPTSTDYSIWGHSGSIAPLSYGSWHHVAIRSFPDYTTDVLFDSVAVLSGLAGTDPGTYSIATILLGEGAGVFTPYTDDFYWDDVQLDFQPFPAAAVTPPLRQRQRAL